MIDYMPVRHIVLQPAPLFQGPPNGEVSNGGVSRSGLVLPFLSFLGLSRFFRDFPDLLGDGPGIFPIRPFSLSRPNKSTSDTTWTSPEKSGNLPGLATPRFSFSQLFLRSRPMNTSGKKKQHKHKLVGPDFPRTFLTLTLGCPGVKKFLPTTGAAGKRTFWCGRPRFSARTSMTRRVFEKLCTKKVCV